MVGTRRKRGEAPAASIDGDTAPDTSKSTNTDVPSTLDKEESPSVPKEEEESSDEEGPPLPMPEPTPAAKKRRKELAFESIYVKNLPSAAMYEKSYMHRDVVTHVVVAQEPQFLITASRDGHVKFWKKMSQGIEFVKHYKAHVDEILGLSVSMDGYRLISTSADKTMKFYDVLGFDMVNMLTIPFTPSHCCWIYQTGAADPKVVVADRDEPILRVFNAESSTSNPLQVIDKIHRGVVTCLAFNSVFNMVVSSDTKGHIEYWSASTYHSASKSDGLQFKFKGETDLYELAKKKTQATSIDISRDGQNIVVTAADDCVRVFRFASGKLRRAYDESVTVMEDAMADGTLQLESSDFGRRLAVEKELKDSRSCGNCIFDESGHFILYSTLAGVKVVNIETNHVVRVLGKVEHSDRFVHLALFQGTPKVNSQMEKHLASSQKGRKTEIMSDDFADKKRATDPTLFCTSFKKHRFFLFSGREPAEERDVFNEKPTLDESQVATDGADVMGEKAVLHTTMGDIVIRLFSKECPKTIENFCTHARNGYYDNVIFHRVIKNFMVQTGDPLGDGTGGESIWGGEFEDEFNRNLRHDRAFTVSMANAGPNTNGSQFFITTVPTPWLDNKHTVFGRVEHGSDTVSTIEQTPTDKYDRPEDDIKIINIDIS